jgi:glycosyltransferase involved in cell wall biosynthesis
MANSTLPIVLYTTSDSDLQGGALRCLLEMATEIPHWGFRSLLVLNPASEAEAFAAPATSLRTLRMPLPRPRRGRSFAQWTGDSVQTFRSCFRLAREVRREEVAVVHVNEILDLYGGIAARLAGVPCVWHVRADISTWPRPARMLFARVVVTLASRVVVVSESVRDHVFADQGLSTAKIQVLHDPGPDPEIFYPGLDGSTIRAEFGIAEGGFLVVLVSKLVEEKGHEVLIRAVPQVLLSCPEARFVIVGGALDGEHHRRHAERLRSLPEKLGVQDAVTFAGYRNDVARIMAAADIVTHCPTHPDPFPGVVLQGMSVGRAVVASNIGGAAEQIEDGVSGVLVPPDDAVALAEAISTLLKDPDRRLALGRAGASQVAAKFSSEAFYGRLIDIYRSLAPGTRRA